MTLPPELVKRCKEMATAYKPHPDEVFDMITWESAFAACFDLLATMAPDDRKNIFEWCLCGEIDARHCHVHNEASE